MIFFLFPGYLKLHFKLVLCEEVNNLMGGRLRAWVTQLQMRLSVVSVTTVDCLQRACLGCSIHVIFQLYPNTEKQTQYSYSGVSYLPTGAIGQSHFTTEHFSL